MSFERRLISEQGAVPADPGAPDAALLSSLAGFGALAERLVRPGVSAEDARLALAMLGADAPLQVRKAGGLADSRVAAPLPLAEAPPPPFAARVRLRAGGGHAAGRGLPAGARVRRAGAA